MSKANQADFILQHSFADHYFALNTAVKPFDNVDVRSSFSGSPDPATQLSNWIELENFGGPSALPPGLLDKAAKAKEMPVGASNGTRRIRRSVVSWSIPRCMSRSCSTTPVCSPRPTSSIWTR
jgi:hypothetical protein